MARHLMFFAFYIPLNISKLFLSLAPQHYTCRKLKLIFRRCSFIGALTVLLAIKREAVSHE
jgi:hypothetical protein